MASDPSDWDPLPDLDAAKHPGEAVAWAGRQNQGARPTEPAGGAMALPSATAAMPPGAGSPTSPAAVMTSASPAAPQRAPTSGPPGRARERGAAAPAAADAPTGLPAWLPVAGTAGSEPAPAWRDQRDARADAMLHGMRQRLMPAAPRSSLVDIMRSGERRGPPANTPAVPVARTPRPESVEAALQPGSDGESRDARRDEPWFRALPVAEQERLSRVWEQERQRFTGVPKRKRQELLEWFWVAYVVFFLAAMPLMLAEGLAGFVRMAMAGCVTGLVWQALPRDRFWCVTSAVVVYVLVVVVPRVHELVTSPFDIAIALGSGCLVAYLAALGAMHDEMQRNGLIKA
jgi:hypothetical protein